MHSRINNSQTLGSESYAIATGMYKDLEIYLGLEEHQRQYLPALEEKEHTKSCKNLFS